MVLGYSPLVLASLLVSCSAFTVLPASRSASAIPARSSGPMAFFGKPKPPTKPESASEIADKITGLTPSEERRQKLEVGTNWPPRTSTIYREGYQFFQGPTPKTGYQADL